MANRYEVGDLVRCIGTFTTAAGVAQDPSGVVFKYKDPSGNTVTLIYGVNAALLKTSTGVYYADINMDEAGFWYYHFAGTGSGQAGSPDTPIYVIETIF